jgi:4-alpha-glucanotransferase
MEPRPQDERRRKGGRAAPPDGWGIVRSYEDAFGAWTQISDEIRDRLVRAMGGDPDDEGPPADDHVLVVQAGETPDVPDAVSVALEDGTVLPIEGRLPADLPLGYHDLRLRQDGATRRLIVSPGRALLPDEGIDWGWATQVYALWSDASWGVGDLHDLREVATWSASVGAGTILVNPLDAVTPLVPRETSPYYPTSRRFLDPLYLRIEDVPGAETVPDLAELADRARRATGTGPIERDEVFACKLAALERIWEHSPAAGHEPGFLTMLADRGPALRSFAVFCTLAEELGTGWNSWPRRFAHPADDAVARFADERADRVRFHSWMQWLCDEQLARASEPLALLGDLPIGADPDGFDAWDWQDVLADGVTVGAPPDELGPQGQNWTLPAFVPWKLRAARYEPYIEMLRLAMRHVGGLRIDHVLGLFRMFWIPPGGDASQGTYVRMPARELLDILALESHRSGTFVVGEDLGTVEEGVREELDARDILRYQVWWFEEDPLQAWNPKALASVSTHDLPTVAGVWTGTDEDDLAAIGQEADGTWHAALRRRIAVATGIEPDAPATDAVVGLHRHVARAPNRIVVTQLDDALAVPHRINVPGTDRTVRADNWSRLLPVPVEDLPGHPTVQAVVEAMVEGRRDRVLPASLDGGVQLEDRGGVQDRA